MARVLRGEIRWADLNPVRERDQAGLRPGNLARREENAPQSLVEIIPEADASKAEPSTTEGKAKRQHTT